MRTVAHRGAATRAVHAALRLAGALLIPALVACASADVDRPTFRAPDRALVEYLAPPASGIGGLSPAVGQRLDEGYGALLRGDLASARAAVAELLAASPDLAPAQVLEAQVSFVEGRVETAYDRLLGVVTRVPEARAAQLLLGRVAELTGDPVTAYVAYSSVGVDLGVAERRREVLREPALQSALGEVSEALSRGRTDRAEEWRQWLESWAPESPLTVRAGLAIAEATGDTGGELEALRRLDTLGVEERPLRQRLAELESERGDPQAAIDVYEQLLAGAPDDRTLEEGLAVARFRFRMQMLPQGVGEAVLKAEVSRQDFASLLYWLVPGVRSSRSRAGVIVSDVPEDAERRQEIVRVVNLGLMDLVNPTLRTFEPNRPIPRGAALDSLLRVPAHLGARLACVEPLERTRRPSSERVCEVAAECGLLSSASACLPAAPTSGGQASTWLRRVLELLERP